MCPTPLLGLGLPVSPECVGPVGIPPSPACLSSSSFVRESITSLCSLPAFGRGSVVFRVLLESTWLLEEGSFDLNKHVLPLRSPEACSFHLLFISMHL